MRVERSQMLRAIDARNIDFTSGQLPDHELRELHDAYESKISNAYAAELKRREKRHRGFVGGM